MQTETKLIPREVLFGNPEKVQPGISPDGKRMSYIAPRDGVLNVWVGEVGSDDVRCVTDDRDRGIRSYSWAHDNRHILYVQDEGGDENWRVYSVDLETGDIRDHTPFDGVQAQIQKGSKRHPHEILIGLNKDNEQLHDVYHLDLRTGELTKQAENPGFVALIADDDLKVRGAVAMDAEGGQQILVRDSEDAEWRPLVAFDQEDALMSGPVGFTGDGSGMYVRSSKDANAGRLVRVDLGSGAEEVLASDDAYDVVSVVLHPDTREPQLVGFLRERLEWQVLDPSIADDIEAIKRIQPGDFGISDRDHADETWLISFTADDGPVSYYAYDRGTKQATFLFDHQPELREYTLAKMEPFEFTARDGLTVRGYITFPPAGDRSNLPAVLNVHGGPWARDSWGFDPEAQWLANRGYACLQVNYRGSVGYGKDFLNAGNKAWGAEMHDDLLDAVEYAATKGWIDRDRVAIYGGSYGGYAALVGATFTPDAFTCAVDIVGPSSLITLIESVPPYWKPMISQFHTRVGNPETERDFLWERSPLSKVDNIRIPLLIAQGANDPRVKQAESEQIVEAMKEKGIDHEYMLFPDEGHGFAKPENRLKFYEAAEPFLAKHLGGRSQT